MEFILWIVAVVFVIAGIIAITRGALLYGIVLIVVGLLIGPGGVSLFDFDDDDGEELAPSSLEVT